MDFSLRYFVFMLINIIKDVLDILNYDCYVIDKAKTIVSSAIKAGSMDNISCIVLRL